MQELNTPTEVVTPVEPEPETHVAPTAASMIVFDGVTKVYEPDVRALRDVSFEVQPHEFLSIVGPSGCGKSTLMKLATGLQFPREGTVIVDGKQVGAPVKLAGMAFQNPTMLPWRTTLDNILLPLEIVEPHRSRLRRHKAEYVAKAEALLAQVGLNGQAFAATFPHERFGFGRAALVLIPRKCHACAFSRRNGADSLTNAAGATRHQNTLSGE